MKMNIAWANTVAQNVTLKFALIVLSGVCLSLAIATSKLALKEPLIVERGCFSALVHAVSPNRSQSEIETFVKEAIAQRFNSDMNPIPSFLAADEEASRVQEQKELATRSMAQTVIVREVENKDGVLAIQSDRLISVGQIRSAFPFPLTATLNSIGRSESNPYGLQLSHIISPKPPENKPAGG